MALQSIRGELTNNLAKLTDIDQDIAKEQRELQEAEDEISRKDITARLKIWNMRELQDMRQRAPTKKHCAARLTE